MKFVKRIVAIGLVVFLTGCTTLTSEPYKPYDTVVLQPIDRAIESVVEPTISDMIPQEVHQGDLIRIELHEKAEHMTAYYGNHEYAFSKLGNVFYVLIPVSYHSSAGSVGLDIEKTIDGQVTSTHYEVNILKKAFEEQSLVVSTTMQETRSNDNLNNDAQKVLSAKSETLIYPMWNEAFIKPVETYRLSTSYGLIRKINGVVSGRHSGMDMAAPTGTPVFAVNDGYVRLAETLVVTGNTIVIDHGMNLYSGYGHLDSIDVNTGDFVTRGQLIGKVGTTGFSTGPHLHFTFTIGRTFVDPDLFFDHILLPE